jgi:hypothetical protein
MILIYITNIKDVTDMDLLRKLTIIAVYLSFIIGSISYICYYYKTASEMEIFLLGIVTYLLPDKIVGWINRVFKIIKLAKE